MKEYLIKIKNFAGENYYVFILLLLSLVFFYSILSPNKILNNVHYINDVTFYSFNMKESIKQGSLPLWTPYYYSGRPLFAQPEYYFIDFNLLLILLTGNIYLAMNFSVIIHLFLAGLGMYLLVSYLSESKKAAFISAFIYMFNGFVHTFAVPGNIMVMEGYSLIPFILFFTIKALKGKEFVFNSVIAGLFVAFQIFTGGVIFLPYLFVLIAVYSVSYLVDKNFQNKLLKLFIVGLIIGAVGFGISAVKLLPGLEFLNLSNRQSGVPYQEYLGEPVLVKNFVFAFISNIFSAGSGISSAVGIMGFALLILGFYKYKNKIIWFSAVVVLLSFFMSTESFLSKFLFHVPIFDQTRHIERAIFLFAFAASILAGFGFLNLEMLIEKYNKINKKIIFSVIIFLIFFELFLIQKVPQSVDVIQPKDIPILNYMSKDTSASRTINLALSDFIGATGYNYYAQYGISEIKGGSGIWFGDYYNYLIRASGQPAKMYGILNNKYAISNKKIDLKGFRLIDRFKDCRECTLWEAFGPYLYNNTNYLPRYYIAPNSILIAGSNDLVQGLIYAVMQQNFQPNSTVLVEGTKINDYSIEFLKKFNVIFLVQGSVDDSSIPKLRQYADQGGKIIPDLFNGQNTVTSNDVDKLFNSTNGVYAEAKIDDYKNNKVVIDLNGEKGWLVASERFAHFPGWTASINGKQVEMLKADNIITAVYLDGEKGKLEFEYAPASYETGKLITIIAVLIIIIYFGYLFYSKKFRVKKNDNEKI